MNINKVNMIPGCLERRGIEAENVRRFPFVIMLLGEQIRVRRYGDRFLLSGFLCLVVLAAGCASISSENEGSGWIGDQDFGRIAVYPFENLTFEREALNSVMPGLRFRLAEMGMDAIYEDAFMDILLEERIRSSGYISTDLAKKLNEELQVSAFITGSIVAYSEGKNPEFGMVARLIDTEGRILWASYASATGDDFRSVLGLGRIDRIDQLVPVVMERVFADFGKGLSQQKDPSAYRIAVLLFRNQSFFKDAGKIVSYLFLQELVSRPAFVPVEFGDIRSVMVDKRIRAVGEIDYERIGQVLETLDIDGIILGAVEDYNVGDDTKSPPLVEISVRLVDAREKKILWYESEHLEGDDEVIALEWGMIRSTDKVARRAVEKLVNRLESKEWLKKK
jgi:hypothetical protein